jgi:Histidine kinase-, DNA gyrase B-, and HSP90-like ATPase
MKKEIDKLNVPPSKRIFHSMIADYDLNRSDCELVDNGLDVRVRGKRARAINVNITLDRTQQTIIVEDDAGGLAKADLRYVVGPGETGRNPTDETFWDLRSRHQKGSGGAGPGLSKSPPDFRRSKPTKSYKRVGLI